MKDGLESSSVGSLFGETVPTHVFIQVRFKLETLLITNQTFLLELLEY